MIHDPDVTILHGDALAVLRTLPAESVQCIITSPPFWGLRDYGVDGQIGLEETPDEWCARLVAVFRECRRVLRDDGVFWLEIGDSYNNAGSSRNGEGLDGSRRGGASGPDGELGYKRRDRRHTLGAIKHKDLVGAPWLLAFALRADGWYLRADCIWARPNPMPESVTDRPTKSHSYVFLLTKRARYFFDADAIREAYQYDGRKATSIAQTEDRNSHDNYANRQGAERWPGSGANARSVWVLATQPTPWAHFATFPEALVERCMKAGTSEHGACSACGAPWRRIIETELTATAVTPTTPLGVMRANGSGLYRPNTTETGGVAAGRKSRTLGWEPSCEHDAAVRPCVVLDPFMGSGTVGLVARRLGRHAIGIELNAEYIAIAERRLQQLTFYGDPILDW